MSEPRTRTLLDFAIAASVAALTATRRRRVWEGLDLVVVVMVAMVKIASRLT